MVLGACGSGSEEQQASDLDQLAWLEGNWRGEHSGTGEFFESWRREGDVMIGAGYQVVEGDTTFGESLRIEPRDGNLYYIADVAHNEGEVPFGLAEHSERHAVFQNPDHDFPQRFAYELRDDGMLYVRASLIQEEDGRVLQFFFRKTD